MSRMLHALRQLDALGNVTPSPQTPLPPSETAGSAADSSIVPEVAGSLATKFVFPPAASESVVGASPLVLPPVQMKSPAARPPVHETPFAAAAVVRTETGFAPTHSRRCSREHGNQFHLVAQQIISRLPAEGSTAIALGGLMDPTGQDAVATPLAAAIAEMLTGRLLVVDTRSRGREIAARLTSTGPSQRAAASHESSLPEQGEAPRPVVETLPQGDALTPASGGKSGTRLDRLMADWKSQYRLVLLLLPPLAQPESGKLAAACSGVYLLIPLQRTTVAECRKAVHQLERQGGQVRGCVLIQG